MYSTVDKVAYSICVGSYMISGSHRSDWWRLCSQQRHLIIILVLHLAMGNELLRYQINCYSGSKKSRHPSPKYSDVSRTCLLGWIQNLTQLILEKHIILQCQLSRLNYMFTD